MANLATLHDATRISTTGRIYDDGKRAKTPQPATSFDFRKHDRC